MYMYVHTRGGGWWLVAGSWAPVMHCERRDGYKSNPHPWARHPANTAGSFSSDAMYKGMPRAAINPHFCKNLLLAPHRWD